MGKLAKQHGTVTATVAQRGTHAIPSPNEKKNTSTACSTATPMLENWCPVSCSAAGPSPPAAPAIPPPPAAAAAAAAAAVLLVLGAAAPPITASPTEQHSDSACSQRQSRRFPPSPNVVYVAAWENRPGCGVRVRVRVHVRRAPDGWRG